MSPQPYYQLPPLDLLQPPDAAAAPAGMKEELMANARLLQQALAQFDIEVALGDIHHGHAITRYELHAAPGIRLEEIAGYSSNLAATLRAPSIRILTPIPGKSSVGVEVPNAVKTRVTLRQLLDSDEWRRTPARIPLALGLDVCGNPVLPDLSSLGHLLIAGDNGPEKSAFLDSLVVSLLYRFPPDQLRFVMVHPNGFELQLYNQLPHLVMPVATDSAKAVLAVRWALTEMQTRYEIFARAGVRNLESFNSRPQTRSLPSSLSYLVVILENVEDLAQAERAEVDLALEHLTLKARAAGILLLLVTQHATRNPILDRFKTEIPAHLTFRCASRSESHSVIGEEGAEQLQGDGDMIYLPPASAQLIRAQAALVTDQEVESVVNFIAQQLAQPAAATEDAASPDEAEEVIQDCIEIIRSEQKASVSFLQRRLRLGYGRAARIMDELENRGIVGPSNGAEPRDILIDLAAPSEPIKQPPVIQPHWVVCRCQRCTGKIEFDANELGDRQSVLVPCPHCGAETTVSCAGGPAVAPEILDFINTSRWCFAKTMPQWPHEYVVRDWQPDKEPAFERFVTLIRDHGYDAPFLDGATYRYLAIGEWKYWTMGEAPNETTLINRAKVTVGERSVP